MAAFCQLSLACPDEKYCNGCNTESDPSKNWCFLCEKGYLDQTTKLCKFDIPKRVKHCQVYDYRDNEEIVCRSCELGFGLNRSTNKCTKCLDPKCAFCDDNNCIACYDSFSINSKTQLCDKEVKCSDPNCNICVSSDHSQCRRCSKGFSLGNTNCIKGIKGCIQFKYDDISHCSVCDKGYYVLSDGSCKRNKRSPTYTGTEVM